MSENTTSFPPTATPVRAGAAIYTDPDDVVGDPNLTIPEKRSVLASWVSDARSVENAPKLRRLDSGAVVEVDAVLEALRDLGRSAPAADPQRSGTRGVVVRLPLRPRRPTGWDDDPPPAPIRARIPAPPVFVDAYAGVKRLAEGGI